QGWLERLAADVQRLQDHVDNPDDVAIQTAHLHMLRSRAELVANRWPAQEIAQAREQLAIALRSDWDRQQALLALSELALAEHPWSQRRQRLNSERLAADLQALSAGLEEMPDFHQLRLSRAALIELAQQAAPDLPWAGLDASEERRLALQGNPLLAHAQLGSTDRTEEGAGDSGQN
ncbi:MAG: hypothetical protein KDI56_17085, partial [Xanthomonadales bacterium]|nr:hypothetical protein [Xanthomonadales bacterium]